MISYLLDMGYKICSYVPVRDLCFYVLQVEGGGVYGDGWGGQAFKDWAGG
jgi:hypothetical protein